MIQTRRAVERKRVLVVEDDIDASTIYTATLQHAGYDVDAARTLKEGRLAAERHPPAIVILDCQLPDGSGLDLLTAWKSTEPMASVPVVVMTAFSDPEYVNGAADAGADAFVVKPCTGLALTSFLERMLSAARPTRRIVRQHMSTRFDAPPIVFPGGKTVETATLHRIDERHFQARCDTCHRSSPVVAGGLHDALRTVVGLGWATHRHGGFACPVCRERGAVRVDGVTRTTRKVVPAE